MIQRVRRQTPTARMLSAAYGSIAHAYKRGVRPYLPNSRPLHFAGVPICYDKKWGDDLVPKTWVYPDEPGYEATLIAGLVETVRPGDRVVIVGAGLGVTAVVSATCAGPSGNVQCLEASERFVKLAQQTAARNSATNIDIQHAVVAKLISGFANTIQHDLGPVLPPSQLPECNVLQMDCEGAEVAILQEMTIRPQVILVETHGLFGAPTELVASLLEKLGYFVVDRGVAEPRLSEICKKGDVRVLLGTLR